MRKNPALVMNRWLYWYPHGIYSRNGRCFDIGSQTAKRLTNSANGAKLRK